MTAAHADLQARMAPTADQIAAGVAALTAAGTDFAIVALAFPDKTFGWWETGQTVEHPAGVWTTNNDDQFHTVTGAAAYTAAVSLGERPGTVGHAVIYPDGTWAVFEDIRAPLTIIERGARYAMATDAADGVDPAALAGLAHGDSTAFNI
jgi:hypothetical protein